ncbi:MAG TPA: PLP-dependent aminotransferase family protein [Polyangiaceae bacterium]|nr:PLP-dependent aminotransferase family protein [Polyangiaceae bacterium]
MRVSTGHLYERLAEEFAAAIERGALRPGERLPSVRGLSAKRGISPATVVQAYAALEHRGLIEPRSRSGYYVRRRLHVSIAAPEVREIARKPRRVSVASAIHDLFDAMADPSVVPIGAACLSPELLPIERLNRLLSAVSRELGSLGGTYGSTEGWLPLRRQLARRGLETGMALSANDLVVTNGALQALELALRAVTRPGDIVAVESPTYFGVLQLVETLGLRAVTIPCHGESGLDLAALAAALERHPLRACVAVPSFNNPSGACLAEEERIALLALLSRYDVPLIEDDLYGDLHHRGARPRPVKAFDPHGRVLYCTSISKTLAPGYRIGWIAGGRYHDRIVQLKRGADMHTAVPLQAALSEFLAGGGYERHLRVLRARLADQVERLRTAVALRFPTGTRVSNPSGGFVLWVELPEHVDSLQFQRAALSKRISVAPGVLFGAGNEFRHYVRLSAGHPWCERTERAVGTLAELARAPTALAG